MPHTKLSASLEANALVRCEWPPEEPCSRLPEGGAGGDIVAEQVLVVWQGNDLIYPISYDPKPLARKRQNGMQIIYEATFLAQLDGQVAYVPLKDHSMDDVIHNGKAPVSSNYLILFESPIAEIHAIRFLPTDAVVIDPFVKHSMPIPLNGSFEYAVWHRAVNGVLREDADPAGITPIVVNLNKVDRVRQIAVRRIGGNDSFALLKRGKPKVNVLSSHFAQDPFPLTNADEYAIVQYGQFIPDFAAHVEKVTSKPWPGSTEHISVDSSSALEQDFLVTWRPPANAENVEAISGELLELEFEGLTGSFAGERGRPGVEYNAETGTYKADLLMARPDGSFYIQPSDHSAVFAMAVALPNHENGNPDEKTLNVFVFQNGNTLRLNPKVWHSVPIPLATTQTGILFREIVAATNANLVINVKAETGHSVQFLQGV